MNVVITGATKGIGRATAQTFAEGGYNIIAVSRTAKDLNEMKEEFIARYPAINFHAHAVDIAKENEVNAFSDWLKSQGMVPDILTNLKMR